MNLTPQNIEAEQNFLGSILLDNSVLLKTPISEEMFYEPKHREIYKAMLICLWLTQIRQ